MVWGRGCDWNPGVGAERPGSSMRPGIKGVLIPRHYPACNGRRARARIGTAGKAPHTTFVSKVHHTVAQRRS